VSGDGHSLHEVASLLLATAREDERPDVRAAALHAAADVLAARWRTTPPNVAAGLPNDAASLVAAAAVTDPADGGGGGEDFGAGSALAAVRNALGVLAPPPSTAVAEGVARRVVVAAEKAAGSLGGSGARGGYAARGFAGFAAAAAAAVRAATGLVALRLPSDLPLSPGMVRAACVILGAADGAGDADLARECRGLLCRVAADCSPMLVSRVVWEAARRVGGEDGEPAPGHEEVVAVLNGHALLMEAALAAVAEPADAADIRALFTAAAHALARQLEPPPAIVASTARADPALELAADPAAAASAPRSAAAAAAARIRLLAAILTALPPTDRHPPRHRRRGGREEDPKPGTHLGRAGGSTPPPLTPPTPNPLARHAPLIVELTDDSESPSPAEAIKKEAEGSSSKADGGCGRDDEHMSVATAAALAGAAYARGAAVYGAGGPWLPGWSSAEAAEAAADLITRALGAGAGGDRTAGSAAGSARLDLDDATRECLARCLGEAAPSLAHSLATELEPRWGGEPDQGDSRKADQPPAPELPPELARTLRPASMEAAVVAAVRLRWLLAAAGYPWVGREDSGGGQGGGGGVVSRVVPCVLRALDHRSAAVRREGCAALVALVAATTRTELRWHGAALLDAAAATLAGAAPEVFGAAAAAHVRAAVAVCSDDPRDPGLAAALAAMMDAAGGRSQEPAVAAAWVAEAPALLSAVKLCAGAHLSRLLPPLLEWLHARDDGTALGAARCLELLCRMTWPRVPPHAAQLWPDVARAYAEADARGSRAAAAGLRAALERVAAVAQLAAGAVFEAAWRPPGGEAPPPELAPLVAYLDQLPARVEPIEWSPGGEAAGGGNTS